MAARDRQKTKAVPKWQETATPKWEPLSQAGNRVTVSAAGHLDNFMLLKPESLRSAAAAFPGRDIAFLDPASSMLYLNKKELFDDNSLTTEKGRKLMRDLHESGQKFKQYTMPPRESPATKPVVTKPPAAKPAASKSAKPAPTKAEKSGKPKEPVKPASVKAERVKSTSEKAFVKDGRKGPGRPPAKVKVAPSTLKYNALKKLALGKRSSKATRESSIRQMRTLVGRIDMDLRDQERTWLNRNAPKPPKVVRQRTRYQAGETYEGKYKLGRYQYVQTNETILRGVVTKEQIVKNTSLHRMGGKARDTIRREMTASAKEQRKRIKDYRHALAQDRRRMREHARAKVFFEKSNSMKRAAAAQRSSAKAALRKEVANRILTAKGYGVKPLHFVASSSGMAKDMRGISKTLPRNVRYPAANYAGKTPMRSPVNMGGVSGRQTLTSSRGTSELADTRIYATTRTLSKETFGGDGRGVFFRIDASEVMRNLTFAFPEAIRAAGVMAGKTVGKRLLDIVEPYVPKDTGLLYSSANTNIAQTAGGLVDIEGGQAYPESQMFGVSISYNAPYAELVYFDENKRHGQAYNEHYGTGEKGDKETARWIEVAFKQEESAIAGLVDVYARAMTGAMNAAGAKI